MLKAVEGNGSSFRFGITNNEISINDDRRTLFPCQAESAQPGRKTRCRARTREYAQLVTFLKRGRFKSQERPGGASGAGLLDPFHQQNPVVSRLTRYERRVS